MPITSGPGGSGTGPGALLAFFVQTAGTSTSTTSASLVDVDATNAAVTFTAPATGKVLVRVTAQVAIGTSNQNAFFGLREATTNVAGPSFAMQGQTATGLEQIVVWTARLSGITAAAHTYKLAYAINGGATFNLRQIGSGATIFPVTMEVWAAL